MSEYLLWFSESIDSLSIQDWTLSVRWDGLRCDMIFQKKKKWNQLYFCLASCNSLKRSGYWVQPVFRQDGSYTPDDKSQSERTIFDLLDILPKLLAYWIKNNYWYPFISSIDGILRSGSFPQSPQVDCWLSKFLIMWIWFTSLSIWVKRFPAGKIPWDTNLDLKRNEIKLWGVLRVRDIPFAYC